MYVYQWNLHTYVCIPMKYTYTCMYTDVIHMHMCVYEWNTLTHVCALKYTYTCMYTNETHIHMYVYQWNTHMHVYVPMKYTYTCMYTNEIHIHMYVYQWNTRTHVCIPMYAEIHTHMYAYMANSTSVTEYRLFYRSLSCRISSLLQGSFAKETYSKFHIIHTLLYICIHSVFHHIIYIRCIHTAQCVSSYHLYTLHTYRTVCFIISSIYVAYVPHSVFHHIIYIRCIHTVVNDVEFAVGLFCKRAL